jgi:hypothetical protein
MCVVVAKAGQIDEQVSTVVEAVNTPSMAAAASTQHVVDEAQLP